MHFYYLIGFLLTAAHYIFKISAPHEPSIFLLISKCLPIFCLLGFAFSSRDTYPIKERKYGSYYMMVTLGLLASSFGDAFLVFQESYFAAGVIGFSIAHCFYIGAFGFKPLNLKIGGILFGVSLLVLLNILRYVDKPNLAYLMAIYSFFLTTMAWRALAQLVDAFTKNKKNKPFPFRRASAAVGAVLFMISDSLLSFQIVRSTEHGEISVMLTYYGAQLAIALSAVCGKYETSEMSDASLDKRKKKTVPKKEKAIASSPKTKKTK